MGEIVDEVEIRWKIRTIKGETMAIREWWSLKKVERLAGWFGDRYTHTKNSMEMDLTGRRVQFSSSFNQLNSRHHTVK